MTKTVLVFGTSGTIGQGVVKVSLEKGYRVVGVFRSAGSAEKTRAHLGNPPQDKFIAVIGNLTSEESAAELQKAVLAKAGEITDVVVSVGAFDKGGPLLNMRVEQLEQLVGQNKLVPNFLAAKYFLPLLNKEGTSYTVINGGANLQFPYIPNMGHLVIASTTLNKLDIVLIHEHKDAPTRINELVIAMLVKQWDDTRPDYEIYPGVAPPPEVSGEAPPLISFTNTAVGNAIVGVITHPNSKGGFLLLNGDNLEQLSNTGNHN